MTYEIYRNIFIICAVLSAVMLVVTGILFVVLKIPVVIGDLTGANARKAIEDIRKKNVATGDKVHKSSAVNRERGKLTDKITKSGNLVEKKTDVLSGTMATSKLNTQMLQQEAQASYAGVSETSLLNENMYSSNETTLLSSNETTLLSSNGTTVLAANDTTLLSSNLFVVEFEVTYIHTDEVIV